MGGWGDAGGWDWGHSHLRKIMLLKPTLTTNKAVVNQGKCGVQYGRHSVLSRYTKSSGVGDSYYVAVSVYLGSDVELNR